MLARETAAVMAATVAARKPEICLDARESLRDLVRIPGVGKTIAQNLLDLGVHSVAALKSLDPNELYGKLCVLEQTHVDRCMLYVFRCAVYFAQHDHAKTSPDPELLKWWNWKDLREPANGARSERTREFPSRSEAQRPSG